MNRFEWLNPFGRCIWYLGCPMTGYDKQYSIKLTLKAKKIANKFGMDVWSPVIEEKISGKGKIKNVKQDLDWKWPMDKNALNQCWGFINLRADAKSFGCEDEYGRHRYSEWQPVIRVSPKHAAGYISIANYQTDLIYGTLDEAFAAAYTKWGTWPKRFIWKIKILAHLPKWFLRQIRRLFQ